MLNICRVQWYFPSWNYFAIFNSPYIHCVLMFFAMKLFCNFFCPIFELCFDVFSHRIILRFLIPTLCNLFWCFPSWKYFAIFNSQYLHWALKFSLKKLFFNFQYPIFALSFDAFAQEIILLFLRPTLCNLFWCFPPWNYFAIFNAQYLHWALMFSFKK